MVRAYLQDAVDASALDAILSAAHRGPSAGNTRSLDIVVLLGAEVDSYWDLTLGNERRPTFPWPGLLRAPVLLLAYVDPSAYVERYAEADKARTGLGNGETAWPVPYWWVDGGAAVENVLLAAHGLDLGACFFGQFDHEDAVRTRFGVPEGRRALGTIALGHPDPANDRQSQSAQRQAGSGHGNTYQGHWGAIR
ncbi:MAG: nitroreductase [Verrucomicrobiales bacterium]|jgi:nitroreductase